MNSGTSKSISVWRFIVVVYFIVGSLVVAPLLFPQARADELSSSPVPTGQNTPVSTSPIRSQWDVSTSPQRRQQGAQIGTKGAATYAADQGYKPVLSATEKITLHGPDGVYYAPDGKLVVIEAKGGTSPLNEGYGYPQGTSENAVAGAKRMLEQDGIPIKERVAYEAVVKEASRGNLRVETVRTTHVSGEPGLPKLEKVSLCSKEATEIGKAATKELCAAEVTIGSALSAGKNVMIKVGGGVGVIGGGFQIYGSVQEIREGKVVEGSFDAARGIGNVTTGSLIISGKVAAGTTVGAAVAVVDCAKDIVVGIRDGDTKRTVVGTVKLAAGSAMSVGIYTGQPEVVVIGGVTYAGVIIYEQKDAIVHGTKVGFDATWNAGVYAGHKTGEGLSIAKDATWNAGAYAARKTGEGFTTAKNATWNGGVAAVYKVGSWRNSAWNWCFKK